jgi:hypothetical protein
MMLYRLRVTVACEILSLTLGRRTSLASAKTRVPLSYDKNPNRRQTTVARVIFIFAAGVVFCRDPLWVGERLTQLGRYVPEFAAARWPFANMPWHSPDLCGTGAQESVGRAQSGGIRQ